MFDLVNRTLSYIVLQFFAVFVTISKLQTIIFMFEKINIEKFFSLVLNVRTCTMISHHFTRLKAISLPCYIFLGIQIHYQAQITIPASLHLHDFQYQGSLESKRNKPRTNILFPNAQK